MTTVLMTSDTVGGVWTYALELCCGLQPHGIRVALATMGELPTGDQRAQADQLSNVTLHVSRFRLEWMADPWDDVRRAGDWLLNLERDVRPDIIHLNGYVHAAMDWQAPVLVVAHSCVLSWWAAVRKEPPPDSWLDYAVRVSAGLARADRLIAPSQAMLDSLRHCYRRLPPAGVIYNGRDATHFRAAPKEPFVLSAGRLWDEAKNLSALNQIAERLPWPVRVAGETVSSSTSARVPAGNVVPLGRLSEAELAGQMSKAAIYALPARYEPFGLSALEAAMSGCALVLGDIESLREVWDDAAIYVPPDDPDAMLAVLRRLIEAPLMRLHMARRAALRAKRYTAQRMVQGYLDLYRRMTGTEQPAVGAALELMKG